MEDIKVSKTDIAVDYDKVLIQMIVSVITAIAGHSMQHLGYTMFGCIGLTVSLSICLYNLYKLIKK